MWVEFNNNPIARLVGDCSVRALSKALDIDWEKAYILLCVNGMAMGDMPSSNSVIGSVLRQNKFKRENIPNKCSDCYSIRDFCMDNPKGIFVIGTQNHVVCAINGNYYDSWDSGDEKILYVWYKNVKPIFYI